MTTELATIPEIKNPLQVFSAPNGLDAIIDKIAEQVKSIDRDISTEAGRDNIRSIAFELAKSKNALFNAGQQVKAEAQEVVNAVNKENSRAWDKMEALQKEIRKPLTDWEEAEKKRVADHEEAIAYMQSLHPSKMFGSLVEDIQSRISDLGNYPVRDWQEFEARAVFTRKEVAEALLSALAAAQKRDAEAAELERLRAEDAARKQKEHEDKIAAEAAAAAKKAAEDKAAEEAAAAAKKAADEKAALDKVLADALAKAEKEKADRIAAEEKALQDAKQAEAAKVAAAQKAEDDKIKAADAAAQAERDKAAAAKKAEDDAAAKRAADTAHKATINNEALAALLLAAETVDPAERNMTNISKALLIAIAKGIVPHVSIKY